MRSLSQRNQPTDNYCNNTESGAAAVILALSVTVLFGSAAIVMDAGDIWQHRRELVGAVDAAALAGAADEADGYNGCDLSAGAYVVSNAPEAELSSCATTGAAAAGTITVAAEVTVEHALAQVLGRDSTLVEAAATARWGIPSAVSGLRPFALCSGSDGFSAWQASGHSTTQIFRIQYNKDHANACGGPAPGNWGILDFDGGSNSNNDTKDWVRNGYPGAVNAPSWISGDPGAFSNSLPISSIVGDVIQLPVFDDYNGQGGANAEFHVIGFVSVIIIDFKANGSQASRYLDIQFLTDIVLGSCCDSGGIDTGVKVVALCGAEEFNSCS